MRKLTAGEVTRMTASQAESFNDSCSLYHQSVTTDSDTGEQIVGFDSGTFSVACGFVEASEYRNERGQIITIDADALLRLPSTQAIAVQDKVVTHGKTYAVDGVSPGHHIQIVKLTEIKV